MKVTPARFCAAGVAVALALFIWMEVARGILAAHKSSEQSAQLALLAEAQQLLEEHFSSHGSYPPALSGLPFTYPDGGDQLTLRSFEYQSDGRTYTLQVTGSFDGREHRLSGTGAVVTNTE